MDCETTITGSGSLLQPFGKLIISSIPFHTIPGFQVCHLTKHYLQFYSIQVLGTGVRSASVRVCSMHIIDRPWIRTELFIRDYDEK